jgi:uncharacterized coiled-coil protein SlyX
MWAIFSVGLLCAAVGSLALYRMLAKWQETIQPAQLEPQTEETHDELPAESETNTDELDQKNAEIQSLIISQEDYRKGTEQTIELISAENKKLEEQLVHKERLREEVEQILAETRATSERRQQRINQLETKVRDLSYEIKTLLQLTDISEGDQTQQPKTLHEAKAPYYTDTLMHPIKLGEQQVQTEEDAIEQLKRCLNTAQKLTGSSHYSNSSSRLRGIPVDNFALDLRSLFDSLRSETSCAVLVYSPKEDKLLFANDQIKHLTGWSADKFIQNFDHIVQEGKDEWREGIGQLSSRAQSKVRLIVKSRSNEDTLIHGVLGAIPTGIFRNHIIVIMYTADHDPADQRDAFSSAV